MANDHLDELANEMFRTFARFEYSLKAAGFHNDHGTAGPNWAEFAISIPNVFDNPEDSAVKEAVDYLLANPPKQQVIEDGIITWRNTAPNAKSRVDLLLNLVRRVRNNLFHGGKFNGNWFAPERSEELLRHSLTVLRACLDASNDVREAYEME